MRLLRKIFLKFNHNPDSKQKNYLATLLGLGCSASLYTFWEFVFPTTGGKINLATEQICFLLTLAFMQFWVGYIIVRGREVND